MDSANYVYFGLAGDFDPGAVAQDMDLAPTSSAAKHSRNPEKQLPRCSLVRFAQTHSDGNEPVLDVYELAEKVISQLEPYTQQFKEVITRYSVNATLQVVFEFPVSDEVSTPALGFSSRVIQFLAATNASIDVDSYRGTD